MGELLAVAFLGGFITGVSPCIVPVLPIVVAGGTAGASRARPFLIIAGLVVSFSIVELIGSAVLSALHLPQDLLYWIGIAFLLALALGLLVPAVGQLVERPFARLGTSRYARTGGGFVLGLSLGLVFVPCAGPVLAAISVAAANHRVNASLVFVTLFYAVGAALPLLVLAVLAQRASGWQSLRVRLPMVRRIAGAVLAVTTLLIAFGTFDPLQRAVPGYTSALEDRIESGSSIDQQLQSLSGEHANAFVKKSTSTHTLESSLPDLGPAPEFTGIDAWLNTPGDRPLTLAQLKGKVVLVDFWTYSCINCQRTLPHVEAWYNRYKSDDFVVVGVHTPEFAFEHVLSNVRTAAHNFGVDYPIALDNNYGTWDAYNNEYWPAEYLIDPTGQVRAYDFGEGNYSTMENNIRSLLTANGIRHLPPRTDVANKTPTHAITQESYVGYEEEQYEVGTPIARDAAIDYHASTPVPLDTFSLNGRWDDHSEEATAGSDAQILLHFSADDVYLVMGGTGTVNISYGGRKLSSVRISGIPKLYTMFSGSTVQSGVLTMSFSRGIQAYDFTFG